MGYEGSWSGMRKYLEKEMLAESLKGRLRYCCTQYEGMDEKIFEVCIDGKQAKRFSRETVTTYFIDNGYAGTEEIHGNGEYWSVYLSLYKDYPLKKRTEYTGDEFCEALAEYRKQDIKISLNSGNPIIRMFAILDRRVGKRTLERLKDLLNEQPEWLKHFYLLRFEAENL